jgi:hypothetical protein
MATEQGKACIVYIDRLVNIDAEAKRWGRLSEKVP